MGRQESLSLSRRLESPHTSLPHAGRLMQLLCPIIPILLAIDFDEDFIDVKSVAVAPVLSFQSSGVKCFKLYAEPAPLAQRVLWVPEAD